MLTITDPVKMKAAAAYNAAADHFDDEALGLWAKYGGRTVERLALQPGATLLDAGCGTGASAIPAAEQVGPTGKVIAVDLADRLLAIARRKAAARKLENIEFRHGDMENLGYPDQFFDAVICVFAIFFVPDVAKQISELWRMVRPNGRHYHLGPAGVGAGLDRLVVGGQAIAPRSPCLVQPMGPHRGPCVIAQAFHRSRGR